MHARSCTTLAQLGAILETGLAGKCQQLTPSGLADLPSTPLLREEGRRGRGEGWVSCLPACRGGSPSDPQEGEAGGWGCGWGAGRRGGVRVKLLFPGGEVCSSPGLAAN
jgi:hypothetical protein